MLIEPRVIVYSVLMSPLKVSECNTKKHFDRQPRENKSEQSTNDPAPRIQSCRKSIVTGQNGDEAQDART